MICIFVKNWSQKETAELSCVPIIEEGDLVKNKEDAIESILYLMREYKINVKDIT
jgi:hypothetical protein